LGFRKNYVNLVTKVVLRQGGYDMPGAGAFSYLFTYRSLFVCYQDYAKRSMANLAEIFREG